MDIVRFLDNRVLQSLNQIAVALIAPVLLTLLLAPTTLWLYRRQ